MEAIMIIRVDFSPRGKELRRLKKKRKQEKKWERKEDKIQQLIRRQQ